MDNKYKRTIAGSIGAGIDAIFNASKCRYYILEHKTESEYHHRGESQKIIVDQIELGRDSSCQVRFGESFETVSRRHAAIVRDKDVWKLIPLSETNATLVNNQVITGEWTLNSGDEIRLSSRGPILGFIIPQDVQSMAKSIGLTERMNLFRKQALRPYKRAIVMLLILLILAVAGLVAWNLYQAKDYEARLARTAAQIQQTQRELQEKEQELLDLEQRFMEASEADRIKLQRQINESRANYNNLVNRMNNLRQQDKELKENAPADVVEAIEHSAAEDNIEAEIPAVATESFSTEDVQPVEVQEAQLFENINDCLNAVYYIKLNDIAIYDGASNQEVVRFKPDTFIGGTGFMLDNGRFVTSNRVVEPWYYYPDTKIGMFGDITWRLGMVNVAVQAGHKVVASFTATSHSGVSFNFKSTDMTCSSTWAQKSGSEPNWKGYTDKKFKDGYGHILPDLEASGLSFINSMKLRTASKSDDWATMIKRDQLNVVKGLLHNEDVSKSPKAGNEVYIVSYPFNNGILDTQNIAATKLSNNIERNGLNKESVIELSSRRYNKGNDGSPVLQFIDGKWTVIGILCHTDSADSDNVVPIHNIL